MNLSWPIFVETSLQMLMGTVDQIMIGRYSEDAVAALANANQIINMFIFLITVLSMATTILIAQARGQGNQEKIKEIFMTSLLVNTVLTIIISAVLIGGHKMIYRWIDVPQVLMANASTYLIIVSYFTVFQGAYFSLVASFRGFSMMKTTMFVAVAMNIIHIIFNYWFIFGGLGLPAMGVAGVAWSNNITRILAFVGLIWLFQKATGIVFSLQALRPFPWKTIRKILYIGVPSGSETFMYQISQSVIMRFVNIFGVAVITTKAYVAIIALGSYLYSIALGAAAQVVVGFLLGAQKQEDVSRKVWRAVALSVLICGSVSTLFYLFSEQILGLFTLDPLVLSLGKEILLVEIWLEMSRGVNLVMVQCLQAAGDIFFPLTVAIVCMWTVAVGLAYFFGVYLGWGLVGIWIGMGADEFVRAIIFMIRWLQGRWRTKTIFLD